MIGKPSLNATSSPTRRTVPESITGPARKLIASVIAGLDDSVETLFANVDDFFFDMANKDSGDQSKFFTSMRKIRMNRADVTEAFFAELLAAIEHAWGEQGEEATRLSNVSHDDMALLSDDEVEVATAKASIAARVRSKNAQVLGLLTGTITTATGSPPTDNSTNPLGAKLITETFGAAIHSLELDMRALLCLLKLFEREVIDRLETMYADALGLAKQSGIAIIPLADDTEQTVAQGDSTDSPSESSQNQAMLPGHALPGSQADQSGVMEFSALQQSLAGLVATPASDGSGTGPQVTPAGFVHSQLATGAVDIPLGSGATTSGTHPTNAQSGGSPTTANAIHAGNPGQGAAPISVAGLVHALTSSQPRYLDELEGGVDPSHTIPNLQSYVLALPDAAGFKNAEQPELDTLRIISALFDLVFHNPDVSLACKALLARLQFPVLKVALVDKTLFSVADHPAREFLNLLAADGVGWPSNNELLQKHRLYLAAERLVQEIDDKVETDASVFARAVEMWRELVEQKRVRAKGLERRVNEGALGKAKLNAARSIVERTINEDEGTRLPKPVVSFIADQLANALVTICIKSGVDSNDWTAGKEVLKTLISPWRSDEPISSDALEHQIPILMAQIDGLMVQIGSLGASERTAISAVETALHDRVAMLASDNLADSEPAFEAMERICIVEGETQQPKVPLDDPRLRAFVPGTWIEFKIPDTTNPLRCRLVVLIDQTQTYVFANDDGVKAYECSVAELLDDRECGRARVLGEQPLVERAMTDLVNNLQAQQPLG